MRQIIEMPDKPVSSVSSAPRSALKDISKPIGPNEKNDPVNRSKEMTGQRKPLSSVLMSAVTASSSTDTSKHALSTTEITSRTTQCTSAHSTKEVSSLPFKIFTDNENSLPVTAPSTSSVTQCIPVSVTQSIPSHSLSSTHKPSLSNTLSFQIFDDSLSLSQTKSHSHNTNDDIGPKPAAAPMATANVDKKEISRESGELGDGSNTTADTADEDNLQQLLNELGA